MPTIVSKFLIQKLLESKGCYSNDPQCFAIAQYETLDGKVVYNLQHTNADLLAAMASPYGRNFRVLWQQNVGLTLLGEQFLEENKNATS